MSTTDSPADRIRTVIATCSPVNADGRPTCRPRIRAASRAAAARSPINVLSFICQAGEDAQHHPPGRGRRVDPLPQRPQHNPTLPQRLHRLHDARQTASQTIQRHHRHRVPGPGIRHQLSQTRTVIPRPGHRVGEHPTRNAGRRQRIELLIQHLMPRAHPGIPQHRVRSRRLRRLLRDRSTRSGRHTSLSHKSTHRPLPGQSFWDGLSGIHRKALTSRNSDSGPMLVLGL